MKITVKPSVLEGSVVAPRSKSQAHRVIIAAAFLGKTQVKIYGADKSDDVSATIDCLKSLGVEILEKEDCLLVTPYVGGKKTAKLNARSSGTTLRFLLPIAAALGKSAEFILNKDLKNRPIAPLLDALTANGVTVSGCTVSGKLKNGNFKIDGSLSSQFISGLIFASAILGSGKIQVFGNRVSKGYIDMTIGVLKDFGVDVITTDYGYEVVKSSRLPISEYFIEGDYSNSAFYLLSGALKGPLTVKGLNGESEQGDKSILNVLKTAGAIEEASGTDITVRRKELNAFTFDGEQTPDLVPLLAVFAAFLNGTTVIGGVERLKIKESDRISGIINILKQSKIDCNYDGKVLTVEGGKPLGGVFYANNDHRIAIAATFLALFAEGDSVIEGAECVNKSYPNFYDDIKRLGGLINVDLER